MRGESLEITRSIPLILYLYNTYGCFGLKNNIYPVLGSGGEGEDRSWEGEVGSAAGGVEETEGAPGQD